MKHIIYLAIFWVLITSCSKDVYFTEVPKVNYKLPGQTAPPDMVFIKGNDSIPSFYMSITEEPNINYVIYLQWLARTYIDYPKPFIEALPKQPSDSALQTINEPYITGYLTNPAYAYYPVVNLTWEQIQKYLLWKTDRLNESILKMNGIEIYPLEQVSEYNFNTEAFIHGQFSMWTQSEIKKRLTQKLNQAKSVNTGILFQGYRLATEKEWDYAIHQAREQQPKGKSPRVPQYLYGKDYFLNYWGFLYWEKDLNNSYKYSNNHPPNLEHHFYAMESVQLPHKDSYDTIKTTLIESIRNYPTSYYGVMKAATNVKEWLGDEYHNYPLYDLNWVQVLDSGGFNVTNVELVDKAGYYVAKDSLGRMPYRLMGFRTNGEFIRVSLGTDGKRRKRVVKNTDGVRTAIWEDEQASNVGFRCILPYTGTPVVKGFKVRW